MLRMNRLANEPSLYLRQHADNPVDWWPWGDDAFAEARRRDVPVLVSIGYSACHWCHVMAHESFEDAYIAGLMNDNYVCVKVDREERPDVDAVYMEAVMMLNGHGGWPLNVFCLPDKRPFFGGTYFPPKDNAHGMIPWPQLIMRISDHYQRNRDDLLENADAIVNNMLHANTPQGADAEGFENDLLLAAAGGICNNHDDQWGGFGQAPKFPSPMVLNFLMSVRNSAGCERRRPLRERIDTVVPLTLEKMARGGIFDQIGGGFSRYAVDDKWLIPHFEKMLYDNGQLLSVYTRVRRGQVLRLDAGGGHRGPRRGRRPPFQRVLRDYPGRKFRARGLQPLAADGGFRGACIHEALTRKAARGAVAAGAPGL